MPFTVSVFSGVYETVFAGTAGALLESAAFACGVAVD
jgi:hypothetical protein